MRIKISNKWLKKKFNCTKDFIINNCHGRCCWGYGFRDGCFNNKDVFMVLLPQEKEKLLKLFPINENIKYTVKDNKNCFFQDESGLCKLHGTEEKPSGCLFTPFAINKNNTLIIHRRGICFKCFNQGEPAYIIFKDGLTKLFGEQQYKFIKQQLENSDKDFYINVDEDIINIIKNRG